MNTDLAFKLAALTYLGLIAAGGLMPKATGLWSELRALSPFAGTLFRVYYAFIGLTLFSFGIGSWVFAAELAAGTPLARGVCGFLTAFWVLRLVAAYLLDVRPYLKNAWWRAGYAATNVVFGCLPLLYAWGALRPA